MLKYYTTLSQWNKEHKILAEMMLDLECGQMECGWLIEPFTFQNPPINDHRPIECRPFGVFVNKLHTSFLIVKNCKNNGTASSVY